MRSQFYHLIASDISKLTPQQVVVYQLLLEGKPNKEIGSILFIEEKTVKFHLTHVFKALEAKSRYELIERFNTAIAKEYLDVIESQKLARGAQV